MFAGPRSHIVDIGGNRYGQYPTHVDSHHWFLETLLRHKCANGLYRCDKPWRLLFFSMGRRSTSPMQCSRRKCVLGRLLLWRQEIVNLPHSGCRLGCADLLHLGWFCVHVHRSPDGHTTPRQAQKTMEGSPCWAIDSKESKPHNSVLWPHRSSGSSLEFADKMHMAWLCFEHDCGCGNMVLNDGSWVPWAP